MPILVFTDGASRGNPGPGGWGAIIADAASVREIGGAEGRTTNNRMELRAAYEALREAGDREGTEVHFYGDSAYVINGATKWGAGWRERGWMTRGKEPVLNRDLWEPLLTLLDTYTKRIVWEQIGGHVAIPGNERADSIATSMADSRTPKLFDGPRAAYDVDLTELSADTMLAKKKSDAKARSRARAYSYVSRVDGIVQVHKTWAECEARVRGKAARYQKVLTPEEERAVVERYRRG